MQLAQFKLHVEIEERHWWFLGRRQILCDLARRLVPPSGAATVVDVGCGTGGNIAALSRDYGCVGIDTSPEAIRFAVDRFPQVRFICGVAPGDLGETAGRADLFLLTDVLEHVSDDGALLSELLTALRPGAHLMLTVPADMSLWSDQDVNHGHYRRYDRRSLERLWSHLPVTVRLISCFNTHLYPVVRAIRILNRLLGRTWGEAGTDLKMPAQPVNRLLTRIFSAEGKILADLLEGRRTQGYPFGVSLIAVLRREE